MDSRGVTSLGQREVYVADTIECHAPYAACLDYGCQEHNFPWGGTPSKYFSVAVALSVLLHLALFYLLPAPENNPATLDHSGNPRKKTVFITLGKNKGSTHSQGHPDNAGNPERAKTSKPGLLEGKSVPKAETLPKTETVSETEMPPVKPAPVVKSSSAKAPKRIPENSLSKNSLYEVRNREAEDQRVGSTTPNENPPDITPAHSNGTIFDPALREKLRNVTKRGNSSISNAPYTYSNNVGNDVFVKGNDCFEISESTGQWSLPKRCPWVKSESERMMKNLERGMRERSTR